MKPLRQLFVLLLLKLDVFFFFIYIFGREEKRNSLAASVLLKIKEDCALLLLLTDTVKNNASEMEPKQRKVCSFLISNWVALYLILSSSQS